MVVLYLCSTVLRDLLLRAFEVVVVGRRQGFQGGPCG